MNMMIIRDTEKAKNIRFQISISQGGKIQIDIKFRRKHKAIFTLIFCFSNYCYRQKSRVEIQK